MTSCERILAALSSRPVSHVFTSMHSIRTNVPSEIAVPPFDTALEHLLS